MKKLIALLMCVMIALFFTITPAQSKSEVGSGMGIPTICNLENNFISQNAEPVILMQALQNWGLLYTQLGVPNLYTTSQSKTLNTRCLEFKVAHYDPGWQNSTENI